MSSGTQETAQRTQPLSRSRFLLFTTITLAIPILVLASTELVLRFFDYGGNLDLVVKRTVQGKEYYSINRSVAKRYFAHSGVAVPEPADDIFEVEKPSNTIRIFCLGESTMAGFPYEFNVTAPRMLQDRLASVLPRSHIEVVNAGLAAVGSYVVLDFMKELVRYQPDLFIVYLGHNEFYGVYQAGSSLKVGGSRWITEANLSLLKLKTYLALRDFLAWIRGLLRSGPAARSEVLMEQMIGDQHIPYRSDVYLAGQRTYMENLQEIIAVARSAAVPVMFSALVSNVRNQSPFVSVFGERTSRERRELFETSIAAGDSLMRVKNLPKAIGEYKKALEEDSVNALAHYRLGLALYAIGDFEHARAELFKGKDLDGLRFRASEEFQTDLFGVCGENGVAVSRVDSSFESHSPNGIIGSELITEHLHPNIEGYFLMAKTWFKTIADAKLAAGWDGWDAAAELSDSSYKTMAPVTDFDRIAGRIKVELLTHRPPFARADTGYQFVPKDEVEVIAHRYVQGQIYWSDARYRLADYYAGRKDFSRARAECLAISKVVPTAYQPVLQMADYYRMEGKKKEAEAEYINSIRREDNPYSHMKLAFLLLEDERAGAAASHLEKGFALSTTTRFKLDRQATTLGRYLFAVSYAKLGRFSEAMDQAGRVLELDPKNAETLDLIGQIQRFQSHPNTTKH